jgi:hypothetical protein
MVWPDWPSVVMWPRHTITQCPLTPNSIVLKKEATCSSRMSQYKSRSYRVTTGYNSVTFTFKASNTHNHHLEIKDSMDLVNNNNKIWHTSMYSAIFTNDIQYKNTAIKGLDDKLTIKYKKILYTLCHQSSFLKYVLEITSCNYIYNFHTKKYRKLFITH